MARECHKYTEAQANFIRDNITGRTIPDLTQIFNSHFKLKIRCSQIRAYARNHELRSGVNCQFSKGHTPFNKGKKGMGGWKPTQFPKGHRPYNYQPVGSERVRTHHSDRTTRDDYIDVKIAEPNVWKAKHIIIWEAHNGPVPKGHAIIFGDGDNRNFDPNNLILVSRKQLVVLNKKRLIQNDADLTRTSLIIADIYSKISERKRRKGKVS